MPFEAFEQDSLGSGPLHQIDARVKLLATLAFVVLVVATPLPDWRGLVAEALALAFIIGLSGLSPSRLVRRWFGFFFLVGFLAILVAQGHPSRESIGLFGVVVAILSKNSLVFLAILTLAGVTPFPKLLTALRRLHVPAVLVSTLHIMYRYLFVLTDELERMMNARTSRSFHRRGRLDWWLLTGLIGVLFIRSMERGERVHAAMLARGWDGTIRSLDSHDDV